jgi:DNA polymerase III epsilon subunit-like protein
VSPDLLGIVVAFVLLAGLGTLWRIRARAALSEVLLRGLEFVAIDTETTGLDLRVARVVSLAAIPFVGGRADEAAGYTRLVNPGCPIPDEAQRIHGISDHAVRDALPLAAVLPELLDACGDRVIVAHTAAFDLTLINRAAREAGLPEIRGPVLDIGALANALFPSWWDLSLEGLGRLTEVEPIDRHTARGDALTAGLIFQRLIPLLEQRGVRTVAGALKFQRRGPVVPHGPGPTGGGLSGP